MVFKSYSLLVGEDYPDMALLERVAEKADLRLSFGSSSYRYHVRLAKGRFLLISVNYDDGKYSETVYDKETDTEKQNPRKPYELEYADQFFACYDSRGKELYLSNVNKKAPIKKLFKEYVFHNEDVLIREHLSSEEEFAAVVKAIKRVKYTQTRNLVNANPNGLFAQGYNPLGLDLPERHIATLEYGAGIRIEGAVDKLRRWLNMGKTREIESIEILGLDDEGFERMFTLESVLKTISIDVKPDENKSYDSEEVFRHLIAKLGG